MSHFWPDFVLLLVVKLRSRSRLGEGQVRVRKVKETKDLDLSYTLFLVFTTHPPTGNSFLALERSYGMVREGKNFKVDFKVDIK